MASNPLIVCGPGLHRLFGDRLAASWQFPRMSEKLRMSDSWLCD
jgi:hypothetical protein